MKFTWKKHRLAFKRPSGTSRGELVYKDSWFIIAHSEAFEMPALGECSLIQGLSPDSVDSFDFILDDVCKQLNEEGGVRTSLSSFPAIQIGLEMLQKDIAAKGTKQLWPSAFTEGNAQMLINGLVWMGEPSYMRSQVASKVTEEFECIKLKIGAIDFKEELALLKWIRNEFGYDIELRVDANGAFSPDEALEKLKRLSDYTLHSIEQPIASGQWEDMARLCVETPLPIALDEELIGIQDPAEKKKMLEAIQPQYIILKPSLIGGFQSTDEWIELAQNNGAGWWLTSALESNVGLNAIAQYTFSKHVEMPQGLGTGSLYLNNVESPLYLQGQFIGYDADRRWDIEALQI